MANMLSDDPADAVTTHPAEGGMPAQRNDKRGLLHMLHDEIGRAIGVKPGATDIRVDGGKSLMGAVDDAVGEAKNANPDNP